MTFAGYLPDIFSKRDLIGEIGSNHTLSSPAILPYSLGIKAFDDDKSLADIRPGGAMDVVVGKEK